jgi:apolipoprotein N-acyltransferase
MTLYGAVAGATGGLCWLPYGFAPLLPLVFVLVLRAMRLIQSGGDAVRLGLAFGAVRYAVAAHFLLALYRYSPLAIVFYLLAIAFILPLAVLETRGALALERRTGLPRTLGFGLIYVVLEKVRTLGDIAFPADLLSHAYGTHPAFLAWAPVIGPYGVTLTIMLVAALFDQAIEAWPRRRVAAGWAAAALALWAAPPLTGPLTVPAAASRDEGAATLRVAIVQPNTTLQDKVDPRRRAEILDELRAMTREAAVGADLVVWPETARPAMVRIDRDGRVDDPEVSGLARETGVPILYGAILAEVGEGQRIEALFNGAALARPDGAIGGWYGKQHLIPFAEGVPLARWVGLDPRRRAGGGPRRELLSLLGNFSSGPESTVFTVGPARIGVLICFEGLFPSLARRSSLAGANALFVLTNDMWWGHSAFAPWHAQMVATRALELDLPVVRAANSGVSSLTDRSGRQVAHSALYDRLVLRVPLHPSTAGPTLYARLGDWILVPIVLAPLVAYFVTRRRRPAAAG